MNMYLHDGHVEFYARYGVQYVHVYVEFTDFYDVEYGYDRPAMNYINANRDEIVTNLEKYVDLLQSYVESRQK